MRILIANDGLGDPGGVQTYLEAVGSGLRGRNHDLAILHQHPATVDRLDPWAASSRRFSVSSEGLDAAMAAARRWQPDLIFSHNMASLDVERALLDAGPVVKFMHGYFGTCISGQKMFAFPVARPCGRRFGPACLALYGPRRCGPLSPASLVGHYRWACEQRSLFRRYDAMVVASEHMKREYVANGADQSRVHVDPLFPTGGKTAEKNRGGTPSVVFFGRMTNLKGGSLLVEAVADAAHRLGRTIQLTMVGDGPQRAAWEHAATRLNVAARFVGWQAGEERWRWLRDASLVVVPSTWPEPFGLIGLEAAALGVPAVAFDVGGISEWLTPGANGVLIPGNPPRASSLADALLQAFQHPETLESMRTAALETARRMTLARHLDGLEHIFATIVETHAHPACR